MPLPEHAALVVAVATHVDEVEGAPFIEDAAQEALDLVTTLVGTRAASIPDGIGRRACIEVAADLFYRRSARNGIVGINSMEVTPVRIQRDPLTPAYPLLVQYLGRGIA